MSATTLTVIAVIVLAIVVIAWLLYRAGFQLKTLKFKGGFAEAELERPGTTQAASPIPPPDPAIEQSQTASGRGSLIEDSPQQAGSPGARQQQRATAGGKIKGSGQTAAAPADQQQQASAGGVIKNSQQRVE